MADSTQTFDRPKIRELQPFKTTPDYVKHGYEDDRLAILVCRIKTWKAKDKKWFDIPKDNCLIIRECESIEVTHSYRELIGTAVIRFPRGTIVEKRKLANQVAADSGNNDGTVVSQDVNKTTANGDLLSYYIQSQEIGSTPTKEVKTKKSLVSLDGTQADVGLTELNQHLDEKYLLSPNDFTVGNRIEIYCGYAYSDAEFKQMQKDENIVPVNMEMVFTGFITQCSVSTPLEISCEDMAHVLKTVNTSDITEKGKMTIKDFLDDSGRFHLLKGTGISLSPSVTSDVIEVAKFHISSQLTVADVLKQWEESGINSYMEYNADGTSTLRVGRIYHAGLGGGGLPTKDKNYLTYKENSQYNIIQFDWDVASDNLNLVNTDKKYLAVRAVAFNKEGKTFGFTLRKADSSDEFAISNDDSTWTIVNQKKIVPKKRRRKKDGTWGKQPKGTTTKSLNRVDLSDYQVIPYVSRTVNCTESQLKEEAKAYWNKYVSNGISGTLTIFGDLNVQPSDIIGLIDPRQPQKNGYYIVESVSTKFGVDGYRKELKLPYKVGKFKSFPVIQM